MGLFYITENLFVTLLWHMVNHIEICTVNKVNHIFLFNMYMVNYID